MMLKKFFRTIGLKLDKGRNCALNGTVNKEGLPYKIKIVRSNKRRRTISARLVEDTMLVYAPNGISGSKLEKVIDKLKKRLHNRKIKRELNEPSGCFFPRRAHPEARRAEGSLEILRRFAPQDEGSKNMKNSPTPQLNKTHDLVIVAETLNKEYFNNSLKISSILYTTNQNKVFGSCNYRTKTIRVSHRLIQMPIWVRDYVIIHEMAHLIEPNHSKAFWDIVSRYKLTERARGYLMAKGLDREEELDDIELAD